MTSFRFHHFGNSFPCRLFRYLRETHQTVHDLAHFPTGCQLYLDGYSGLGFQRLLQNPETYLRRLRQCLSHGPIDVLSIDLGTNDLCDPNITPMILVNKVLDFISFLQGQGICPRYLVFFSVI